MKLGRQFVGLYAPQAYWMKKEPVSFAETTIASWKDAGIDVPLVLTAQSYWDSSETPPQKEVESKLAEFVSAFPSAGWSKIAGLNWYHAGGSNTDAEGAMSDSMIDAIARANIPSKPFGAATQPAIARTT